MKHKIKLFIFIVFFIIFIKLSLYATWWYGNIAGYQAGRKTLDILKLAVIDPQSRFGIGTTF